MKFKILYSTLVLLAGGIVFFPKPDAHSNGGGAPTGYTGSPLEFSGRTCGSGGGCHGGGVTDVAGWITSNIPDCGYTPGQTYNITVFVTSAGRTKFGFSCSPQRSNGNTAGTLISAAGMQINGGGRYITHTSAGTAENGSNSRTWNFQWTAPAAGSGTVTFYSAMNATNSSNSSSGDIIFKSSLAVIENTPLSITSSISGNTFCQGSNVTLTSSAGSIGNTWLLNNNPIGSNATLNLSTGGIYVLQHAAGNCIRTTQIELIGETLPATPVISNTGDATLCPGESVTLSVSGGNATWLPSGTVAPSIVVNSAGTYSATRNNSCGSASSADVVLVSESFPISPELTSGVNFRLCADSSIVIEALSEDAIVWLPGNESGPSLEIFEPGSYSAVSENACGTSDATTFEVVPRNIPETPLVTPSELIACEGEEAQLIVENIEFEDNVTWLPENQSGPIYFPTESGIVTVVVSNICGTSAPVEVSVDLLEIPATPIISLGDNGELIAETNADSIAWFLNGEFIENESDTILENPVLGLYTAIAFNQNVCASAPSAVFDFNPTYFASALSGHLSIYPNPSSGLLAISLLNNFEPLPLYVFDQGGRLVFEQILTPAPVHYLNMGLAPGNYFVKYGMNTKKLVIIP